MSNVDKMTPEMTPDKMTPLINQKNVINVREMIALKKRDMPFYATSLSVANIVTDMDHFPYSRFYRGVPGYHRPVVMEREAGWRPNHNNCYVSNEQYVKTYPNHCFEGSCSLVTPCHHKHDKKFTDQDSINTYFNSNCIVQYR